MSEPNPVLLADLLTRAGVPLTVVGGTERWVRASGDGPVPRDLDILLPPTDEAIAALLAALPLVDGRSRTRRPRDGAELVRYEPWQLFTRFGGLDVFVRH